MLFLCWGITSQLVPAALGVAMEEDVEYRQGLPLDYLTYMGVQNSDKVIDCDDDGEGRGAEGKCSWSYTLSSKASYSAF